MPKLYIKCTRDKEFSDFLQISMAVNLGAHEMVSFDSGHLPMLRRPKMLAGMINRFTESLNEITIKK